MQLRVQVFTTPVVRGDKFSPMLKSRGRGQVLSNPVAPPSAWAARFPAPSPSSLPVVDSRVTPIESQHLSFRLRQANCHFHSPHFYISHQRSGIATSLCFMLRQSILHTNTRTTRVSFMGRLPLSGSSSFSSSLLSGWSCLFLFGTL
jgi:hypothetical protein